MRNNKAIFFSSDALMALILVLMSVAVLYPVVRYSFRGEYLEEDIVNILSSLDIGEINNSYVDSLISQGRINNLNKTVLEQIGEFYVSNLTEASLLTEAVLSGLNITGNIGIWFGEDLIYSINSTPYDSAQNVDVGRQMISGIEKGKLLTGYVAKAWLKKINQKENSLFVLGDMICGGYRTYSWGDYYLVKIPGDANVTNATWLMEGSWVNQYNRLYVNGISIFNGTIGYYQIFDITHLLSAGNNIVRLSSTMGGDDGASHVVVEYDTTNMSTFAYPKFFPFNIISSEALLHYEKSLFIPTDINHINVSFNTSLEVNLSLRKGASNIFIGKKNPVNNSVVFNNSEIQTALSSQGLNYLNLSNEYFFFIVDIGEDHKGQLVTLGDNSYVYVNSSEIVMPFGTIDITEQSRLVDYSNNLYGTFYRNLNWTYVLPNQSIPVLADWQFGWLSTGDPTGQNASVNGIMLYNSPPDPFIEAFSRFGYSPSRGEGLFNEGDNYFNLDFGQYYGVSTDASYGYLTYFIKSFVNYDATFEKSEGGTRTMTFEDNSTIQIQIGNASDPWNANDDAIDNAVDRLLSQLDTNQNGKIDLMIDDESFDIESFDIEGVPWLWSTEVQVRRWY